MRWITIPEASSFSGMDPTGKPIPIALTFAELMMNVWTLDAAFGEGLEALERQLRIRDLFRGKQPGDVVVLDEADWTALCRVVNAPRVSYNPAISSCLALLYAVTRAPDKDPRPPPLPPEVQRSAAETFLRNLDDADEVPRRTA